MLLKKILSVLLAVLLLASTPVTILAEDHVGGNDWQEVNTEEYVPEEETGTPDESQDPDSDSEETEEEDSATDDAEQSTTQFTVKFFVDGVSYLDYEEQTIDEGEKAVQPKDPLKLSLDFDGWYFIEDLGDLDRTSFNFDTPIEDDIELHSQFTATVRFIANSSEVGSKRVVEGGKVEEPERPEREGYTFIAWRSQQLGAFNFESTSIDKHLDLIAQFLKDSEEDRYAGYWHYEGPGPGVSIRGFVCPNCKYTAGTNVNYNHPFHLYFHTHITDKNLALIVIQCKECKVTSEWSPTSNGGVSLARPNAIPSSANNMGIGDAKLKAKYVTVQFLPGLDGVLSDNGGPYWVEQNENTDNSWKTEWEPEVYANAGATHIGWMNMLDLEDEDKLYPVTDGFPAVVNKNYEFVAVYTRKHVVTITAATTAKKYDGTALSNPGYEVDNLPIGYTLTAKTEGSQTNVGSSDNVVSKNEVVIMNIAGEDVTGEFHIEVRKGTLTVTPRSVTLTSASDSKAYDGTPLTNDNVAVSGDGFADGEGAEFDVTGTIKELGSVDNAFTYTLNEGTLADNYIITEVCGELKIIINETEIEITIKANSKMYDGTALTPVEHEVTGLPEGYTLTVTSYTGSIVNVSDSGDALGGISGYTITRIADGMDVTEYFAEATVIEGALKLTQRFVTLKSAKDSKIYDGTPLTNDTIAYSDDGFIDGEGLTCYVTGKITDPGRARNLFTFEFNEVTTASNYIIGKIFGILRIEKSDAQIEITAASDEKVYDGAPLANDGFTYSELPAGVTSVTAAVVGIQTDVGSSANVVMEYTLWNGEQDVTEFFTNVTLVDGILKVTANPAAITITAKSDSKAYDGTPL